MTAPIVRSDTTQEMSSHLATCHNYGRPNDHNPKVVTCQLSHSDHPKASRPYSLTCHNSSRIVTAPTTSRVRFRSLTVLARCHGLTVSVPKHLGNASASRGIMSPDCFTPLTNRSVIATVRSARPLFGSVPWSVTWGIAPCRRLTMPNKVQTPKTDVKSDPAHTAAANPTHNAQELA